MYHNSQRTNTNFKPKWPRLQFLKKKREANALDTLDAYLDAEFLIKFKVKS
jgi:hypothetical protein